MINLGYIQYVSILLLLTGLMILLFDVKVYGQKRMKKEKKAARFMGWLNVSLGILTFVANWANQMWF